MAALYDIVTHVMIYLSYLAGSFLVESLNSEMQMCKMDGGVRYWNEKENIAEKSS